MVCGENRREGKGWLVVRIGGGVFSKLNPIYISQFCIINLYFDYFHCITIDGDMKQFG